MGFITAEALYPGAYTTHTNTVSHLGASEPPNSVVPQPSAAIFDSTIAFTAFLAGGVAVILSSRRTAAPFRHLWTVLGAASLGATVLGLAASRTWAPMAELGEGGLERWIVYPIVLWLVAFGSHLMAGAPPREGAGRSV